MRQKAHDDELTLGCRIEDFPEIIVFLGILFDVGNKSLHNAEK
jgi:hypothetical protein